MFGNGEAVSLPSSVFAPRARANVECYEVGGDSTYCTNGSYGCYWSGGSLKWCH